MATYDGSIAIPNPFDAATNCAIKLVLLKATCIGLTMSESQRSSGSGLRRTDRAERRLSDATAGESVIASTYRSSSRRGAAESFCSVVSRRRRVTPVMTSTFENVSHIGVCLLAVLDGSARGGRARTNLNPVALRAGI